MSNISVYLRLRPLRKTTQHSSSVEVGELGNDEEIKLSITNGNIHRFKYNFIFPENVSQEAVFNKTTIPLINDFFKGVNATLFAYGQTGSGKTFTITGGSAKYEDRGIIPRSISEIFSRIQDDDNNTHLYVSYLEIYNEYCYDLLTIDATAKCEYSFIAKDDFILMSKNNSSSPIPIDDTLLPIQSIDNLNRVTILENENGEVVLRGLNKIKVNSEEDALNLLFFGDTNRVIAETPSNDASTRSHCVFILNLVKYSNNGNFTSSKLKLVDLAGSERTSKTNIEGQIFKESRYINLSLHYLEGVINALQSKHLVSHIPYRNSVLTMLLKDSLGGNSLTSMIGNVNCETTNSEESLSTLRFADRVSSIKNQPSVNKYVDDKMIIKALRAENLRLKNELELVGGSSEFNIDINGVDREEVDKVILKLKTTRNEDLVEVLTEAFAGRQLNFIFSVLMGLLLNQSSTPDDKLIKEINCKNEQIQELLNIIQELKTNTKEKCDNNINNNITSNNLPPKEVLTDKYRAFEFYCSNVIDEVQFTQLRNELEDTVSIAKKEAKKAKQIKIDMSEIKSKSQFLSEMEGQGVEDPRLHSMELEYNECTKYLGNLKTKVDNIKASLEDFKVQTSDGFVKWFQTLRHQYAH